MAKLDPQACFSLQGDYEGRRATYRQVKHTLRKSWTRPYDYPTTESHPLADKLNEFYCRFGGALTSISPSDSDTSQLSASPDRRSLLSGVRIQWSGWVRRVCVSSSGERSPGRLQIQMARHPLTCTEQLAPIFTQAFIRSVELCEDPSFQLCQNNPGPTEIMQERTTELQACCHDVCGHKNPLRGWCCLSWRTSQEHCWTTCCFPIVHRSVEEAVNMGLEYILQHLDSPGPCAKILFVEFSSAFNSIVPESPYQTDPAHSPRFHLSDITTFYSGHLLHHCEFPLPLNPPVILCQLGLIIVYYVCYFA